MDKRRGGCAPNIAYTLALLGERPRVMATAGEDFGEYRHWLDAAGVDTSLIEQIPASSARRSSAAPTANNNQIASFYTARWPTPDSCRSARYPDCTLAIIAPNDPRRWCSTRRSAGRCASAAIFDPGQQCAGCRRPAPRGARSARPT
jgi:adenosine kinase